MAEFIAFDPNAEVMGTNFLTLIELVPRQNLTRDALLENGINIDDIHAGKWYSQQSLLNVWKQLALDVSFDLVAVGMRVPDSFEFPPEINSVETALGSLNIAYQMAHRGGEIGEYRFEKTGERSGTMICHNPYPSDLDYGIVYRLVQKFRTDNHPFTVRRDENAPSRKTGGDSCTFNIEW